MVSLRLIPITAFKHVYSRTSFSFSLGFSDSLTTQVQTEDTRVCPLKGPQGQLVQTKQVVQLRVQTIPSPTAIPSRPEFVEKVSCAELLLSKYTSCAPCLLSSPTLVTTSKLPAGDGRTKPRQVVCSWLLQQTAARRRTQRVTRAVGPPPYPV